MKSKRNEIRQESNHMSHQFLAKSTVKTESKFGSKKSQKKDPYLAEINTISEKKNITLYFKKWELPRNENRAQNEKQIGKKNRKL